MSAIRGYQAIIDFCDRSIYTDILVGNITATASSQYSANYAPEKSIGKEPDLEDHPFPEPVSSNKGWLSSGISDANKMIDETIQYTFTNAHTSYHTCLVFRMGYVPADFTVTYYLDNEVMETISVVDNRETVFRVARVVPAFNRIVCHFTKMSKKNIRMNLQSFEFAVYTEITEDEMLSIDSTLSTSYTEDYNESDNTTFRFLNQPWAMDIVSFSKLPLNMQTGFPIYVKENREFLINNFYFEGYRYNDITQEVEVTAYDTMYNMGKTTYKKGTVGEKTFVDVFSEITENFPMFIDESFRNLTTAGYIPEVTHREALRMALEASDAYLATSGVQDFRTISPFYYFFGNETYTDYYFTDDDILNESLFIENDEQYTGVIVNKYTFSPAQQAVQLGYIKEHLLTGSSQTVEMVYSTYPADVDSVEVFVDTTAPVEIVDVKKYSERVLVTLRGLEGYTTFITVTGKPYNTAITELTMGDVTIKPLKIDNKLITSDDLANKVLFAQFNRRVNRARVSLSVFPESYEKHLPARCYVNTEKMLIEKFNCGGNSNNINIGLQGFFYVPNLLYMFRKSGTNMSSTDNYILNFDRISGQQLQTDGIFVQELSADRIAVSNTVSDYSVAFPLSLEPFKTYSLEFDTDSPYGKLFITGTVNGQYAGGSATSLHTTDNLSEYRAGHHSVTFTVEQNSFTTYICFGSRTDSQGYPLLSEFSNIRLKIKE